MRQVILAAVAITWLLWTGSDRHQAYGEELDLVRVKEQVIGGIRGNYAELKTIRVTVEQLSLDPSVIERTEESYDLAGGGRVTFVREPWSVDARNLTLRGTDLRSDPAGGAEGTVWTFVDGVWTQFVPEHETAWVRRQDQMPGMFPIDPRDVGSTEVREPLLAQLQSSDLKSAETVDGRLHLLWEHAAGRRAGMQYRCVVDPQKNHLPHRFEYLGRDGKPFLTIDIRYQELVDGAWFLREAELLFHISGQIMQLRTLGRPQINEPITDEAFEIDFPESTFIRD